MSDSAPQAAWRPIKTAPKDGTRVVLFGNTRWPLGVVPAQPDYADIVTSGYFFGGHWQVPQGIGEPTHWQPLPEPPKP